MLGFLHRALHDAGHPVAVNVAVLLMLLTGTSFLVMLFYILFLSRGVNVHVDVQRPEITERKPDVSPSPPLPSPPPSVQPAARLIHAADCRWAEGSNGPAVGDDLSPGRKLVLDSGLAEIMFISGATALLEGPAKFEIGSRTSGLLNWGKVTVTILDEGARGFAIHTPGMKYTDLGTEFGVLVAKSGEQEVHVFRGKVEAGVESGKWEVKSGKWEVGSEKSPRPSEEGQGEGASLPSPSGRGAGGEGDRGKSLASGAPPRPSPLILSAGEAIRVEKRQESAPPVIVRQAAKPEQFVRVMPGPVPFPIFSTGAGLDRGAADPHWEIIAVSTEPKFAPQHAVVFEPKRHHVRDDRGRAHWISRWKQMLDAPNNCRWTFRTKFDLTGFDPAAAAIEGCLSADD